MSSESDWDGGSGSEESEENSSIEEEDLEGSSGGKCALCGGRGRELREVDVEREFRVLFPGIGGGGGRYASGGGSDKLQVCGGCHLIMKSALVKRRKVVKIECRVRSRQLEILKELRQLQGEMGRFYEEMVKLEGIATRCRSDKVGSSFGLAFRTKIIEAVKDLGLYRESIAVKLECSTPTADRGDAKSDQGSTLSFSPVVCKAEPVDPSGVDEVDHFDDEDFLSSNEPYSPKVEPGSFRNSYQNLFRRVQRNSIVYKESEKLTQSMPPFKRHIVRYIIRTSEIRKAMEQEGLKSTGKKVEGPEFEYDFKSEKITIGNVEVALNEHLKSLHCSLCPVHKMLPDQKGNVRSWNGLCAMRVHVLSAHLNTFQCTVCGKNLASNKTLHLHMTIRHPGHVTGKKSRRIFHICDVCGRPFVSKKVLVPHKWSHLNAEEKEDAISKGLGPPPPARVPGAGHQCSKCGKKFKWKCSLKLHEMNESCSKPPGYRGPPKAAPKEKARKYFCRRGCGRELHDAFGRRRHERRCDGKGTTMERKDQEASSGVLENESQFVREEYPCQVCGRGMASKTSLKAHLLTHMSDEERAQAEGNKEVKGKMERKVNIAKKNLICPTCGKLFKTQKTLKIHERKFHS